jgi:peptidoglycan hydrolase-like protein with peptidoglycan-binding domain
MPPRILFAAIAVATTLGAVAPAAAQRSCDTAGMPASNYAALVEGIQRELAINGFDPGGLDGKFGPNTREAIRTYQRAARLPVTGCPSQELIDHLSFHLPKVYAVDRPEMPTEAVELQEELTRRGYYLGGVDGRLGGRTRMALRQYQQDAGLPVTGELTPDLLQKLKNDRATRRSP